MAKILCIIAKSRHSARWCSKIRCYPAGNSRTFAGSQSKDDDFVLVRAVQQDTDAILKLMWEAYYPDEPTVNALGLGLKRNIIFDDIAARKLCKGTSLVARCKADGSIVGAAISEFSCPWDPHMMERFACTLKCKGVGQLLRFYAHVIKAPELWKKHGTNHIFHISDIFVRREYRNKGLARKLMGASRDLASELRFKLVRVDARNHYLARACKHLNLKEVYALKYSDFIDEKNEAMLIITEPHSFLRVFIDTLN